MPVTRADIPNLLNKEILDKEIAVARTARGRNRGRGASSRRERRSRELARKRPGRTPRPGETVTIKPRKKGQRALKFKKGGLHASTGTPQGEKIPASKVRAALAGKYGEKAQKQARFYQNVLKKGQKTAARHRRRKR